MERRSSENVDAAIFEYRVTGDAHPLHSSYVKKQVSPERDFVVGFRSLIELGKLAILAGELFDACLE